ncbi:hypothetical protein DQ04_01371090 [Trypanosoma grayi]|uniref:hypothetical protein n=1 Tax=Trypanosoma grayi TaxID=71804 RepID=UPI0004F3F8AD|nr:hypothetical protein DQ04_01371090 [Trypanosoma grayi]KEG12862.1 hypothetical protein DQ04_01371090 [Trypanosoma grayi]
MRWIPLDLSRSADICSQVDTVINTYTTLQRQLPQQTASNPSQIAKALAVLRRSFADRLEEMAVFYQENDLDARSAAVEAARLRLKRFLRSLDVSDLSTELQTDSSTVPPHDSMMMRAAACSTGNQAVGTGRLEENDDNETVTIRIVLTEAEYNEILTRREALRQLKLDSVVYNR